MRAARALLLALAATLPAAARAQDRPGDFDFYVLSLSWSPTWCATDGQGSGSPQCRRGAGFGFVVHGLWPQYEEGYPESCFEGRAPWAPDEIAAEMADLMPDRDLVFHEWRRHGTCSGLSQEDYFAATRAAYERIAIPAAFEDPAKDLTLSAREAENAFIAANNGLKADGIAIACGDGTFEEVRICLTRDLAFRACEEVERRGCRQRGLHLESPR